MVNGGSAYEKPLHYRQGPNFVTSLQPFSSFVSPPGLESYGTNFDNTPVTICAIAFCLWGDKIPWRRRSTTMGSIY